MASYSVEAILTAVDRNFSSTMKAAQAQLDAVAERSSNTADRVGRIADGMIGFGKALTAGVTTPAVLGIGSVIKSFGKLEQNVGGTQAVFGDFHQIVQNDARKAYRNMGLSASEYMATANKMGSLFQGSGLTQRRSLELTSQAMQRAADVASVMGVDVVFAMESIANAAKGNFTMMDNLGVAMNATTLEAYALEKGINFKWNLASNAEKEELAIRMFMDRTQQYAGNFAREVDDTIAGSFDGMKAAFKDLTAGLGSAEEDVKQLFDNLYQSTQGFAQNVKRVLGQIWENLPLSPVQKYFGVAALAMGPLITGVGFLGKAMEGAFRAPAMLSSGLKGATSLFGGLKSNAVGAFGTMRGMLTPLPDLFGGLTGKAQGFIGTVGDVGRSMVGVAQGSTAASSALTFLTGGGRITDGLHGIASGFGRVGETASNFVTGVGSRFPMLTGFVGQLGGVMTSSFTGMMSILQSFASVAMQALLPTAIFGAFLVGLGLLQSQFGEQISQMAQTAVTQGPTIITNFINGLVSKIPDLITQGTQLIETLTQVIVANAPAIFQGAVALISSLVQGVGANAPQLIASAIQIIGVLINGLLTSLPQLLAVGMQFLVQLAQGVVANIPLILSTAQSILLNFINSVSQHLPSIIQSGIQIIMSLVEGFIQNLPQIVQTATTIIGALLKGLASALPQIVMAGIQLILKLAWTILVNLPTIVKAGIDVILGLGKGMLEAIPTALTAVWDGIKNGFASVWDWVTGKNTEGAESTKSKITETAATVNMETANMAATASANVGQMAMNLDTLTSGMQTSVQANTGAMALGVGQDTGMMATTAIENATALNVGVSEQLNSVNADGLSQTLNFAAGVGQNFATANTEANAQAQAIHSGVSAQLNATAQSGQTSMAAFSGNVSAEMAKANQAATQSANQMSQSVTASFNQMKSVISSSMNGISSDFVGSMNKLTETTTQAGNKMKSVVQALFSNLKSQTQAGMNQIQAGVASGMQRVVSLSQQAGNQVVSIFRNVAGQMQAAGHHAGMGFYSGLAGTAGSIYSLAASIANTVASTIRRALAIRSPSRVMKALGGFTGQGMAVGMEQWVPKVESVAERLAVSAQPKMGSLDLSADLKAGATAVEHSLHSRLDVKQAESKQPLEMVFDFGRQAFRGFVEDIFAEHAKQEKIHVRMQPM